MIYVTGIMCRHGSATAAFKPINGQWMLLPLQDAVSAVMQHAYMLVFTDRIEYWPQH